MKIKVTNIVKRLDGEPVIEADNPVTFRVIFHEALNNFRADERPTAELKSRCFGLMSKVFASDEINITTDEGTLLKERVNAIYNSSLIYGRVCELIEGGYKNEDNTPDENQA